MKSRSLHLAVRPGSPQLSGGSKSPPPRLGNWSRISCGRVAASHETATLAAWSEVFAGVCHPGPDPSSLASGTGGTASTQPSTKRRFQAVGCVEPVPAVPPADAARALLRPSSSSGQRRMPLTNQTDIDRVMVFQKLWIPRDVRLTAQAALAES